MEFLTNIEQDGKKYSVRDLAAHVMIDSTRLDLKNFKRNSNIKLDSLEKLFNSFKSYAVCTKTDEGVPDVDEPSKSVIYLVKITAEGEEDPKYEMWIYDVTDTWQNLGISTTNIEGFIKTDDLGSELYYGSDDKKVHINVDNSTIKLSTAGKLTADIEANKSGDVNANMSTIGIAGKIYSVLPEAGVAVDYSDNQVVDVDNELKVEQENDSGDFEELVYTDGWYSTSKSNKIKITLPKNFAEYESVKVDLKSNIGEIHTFDLKTFTGDYIFVDAEGHDAQDISFVERTSNSFTFWNYGSLKISIAHTQCKYAPRTDGKKLNVQIDNTTIKVNDDNELYADLSDLETAVGKDTEGNLVNVSKRIKDEAANANYDASYSYDDDITINKVTTIIPWTEEFPELELAIDFTDSGTFVNHGYFRRIDGDCPFEFICYTTGNSIKPEKLTDNKWHIVLMTINYYFIYDPAKTNELKYDFQIQDKAIKIKPRVLVETSIKNKIDSVEDSIVNVEANPTEEAAETLSKIKIDDTIYSIDGSVVTPNVEFDYTDKDGNILPSAGTKVMIFRVSSTSDEYFDTKINEEGYRFYVNDNYFARYSTTNNRCLIINSDNEIVLYNKGATIGVTDQISFEAYLTENYGTPVPVNGLRPLEISNIKIDDAAYRIVGQKYSGGNGIEISIDNVISSTIYANPTEEATEDLTKIKVGDTVYSVGSSEGPSKIYDSATDTTYHGNLWETDDGSITVGSSEDGYNELEIYYSSKDSGQIQYYKINTEMITSPKTDKGMFYVLVPGSNGSAFDFEQIEVSNVTDTEGKKSVKLASKAGTDSIVKIERVYNI